MSTSAREIAELNIKHYQNLLKTETDPKKRQTIAMLLAEEEFEARDIERTTARAPRHEQERAGFILTTAANASAIRIPEPLSRHFPNRARCDGKERQGR